MRRLPSWWLLVLTCIFSACGSEEPPINQVGVNVVEKALFKDSWYMSRTVIDVDYEAAGMGTFPGDIASDAAMDFTALPRIRWVIDKSTLFAYRDYELVQGGDGTSKAGQAAQDKQDRLKQYASPVAAYKIEKHFDIKRAYNASTGEERNVVTENDADRPWYERKFMRVDWSKNLLPGYFGQTQNLYELLGNYTRAATDLYVQDVSRFPKSYAPRFDRMRCEGLKSKQDASECPDYERDLAADYDKDELYHMSFVSQETLSPGLVADPETGQMVNWCAVKLYTDAPACSAVVSYVRTSFLKVSDRRHKQYEPVNFEDDRFERFGFFRLAAPTIDRSNDDPSDPAFGATDFLNYNVNRHNIWQQWTDKNGKSIPFEEREVRPIVWYTTPELPAHLVQPSYDLVAQWNESFMGTVRRLRGQTLPKYGEVKCQREDPDAYCYCDGDASTGTPGTATCAGHYDPFRKPTDYGEGTVNPFDCYVEVPKAAKQIDMDNPALSDADFNPWFGAKFTGSECVTVLRTNTCNRGSLAAAGDKKGDLACQERGDLRFKFLSYVDQPGTGFLGIATLRGDPVTGEIIAGDANIGGPALDSYRTSALQTYDLVSGNLSELEFQVGEDVRGYFENLGRVSLPARPRTDFVGALRLTDSAAREEISSRMNTAMTRLNKLSGPAGRQAIYTDRLKSFVGTDLERRLVAGLDEQTSLESAPGDGPSSLTEGDLNRLSPLRNSIADRMHNLHDKEFRFSRANVTMPNEYADDSVQWFVSRHADWPRARLEFAINRLLFRQTELHELGHCFGLRHDFGASADSEHYRDEYYALEKKYPNPDPTAFDTDGTKGFSEPETRAYEVAYGNVRAEREKAGIDGAMSSSVMEYTANWYERLQPLGKYDNAAIAFTYGDMVEAYSGDKSATGKREMLHYFQGGESCQTDSDCPYSRDGANADHMLDANMENGVTQHCVANPRVSGAKLCSSIDDELSDSATRGGQLKPLRYRFCTDERADTTLAWCNRFDEGDNYRDIVRNIEESYDRMYIFSAFRRYRAKWDASTYTDALLGRRLNILQNVYQNLAYEYANNPGFREQTGSFGFYDQFLATTDILNFYARILAQPSVGSYRYQPQTTTYQLWSYSQNVPNTQLSLSLGMGRYFYSDYQSGLTGIERLERVGTFFDKARVIELLAQRGGAPDYTRDVAFFSNFYDLFPNEMQQIFTGMIRGYPQAYMPRLVCDGAQPGQGCAKPRLVYMDFYRGDCSKAATCLPNPAETTYANLPVLDGGGSLTLQIYAALYGLAYFPVYFDTTFQNQLFVCIEGQADCYQPSANAVENKDYVRYTSPRYRRTFVAFQVEPREGVAEQTSIGFAMVKEAYELDIALTALRKMKDGPEPNSVTNLSPDDLNLVAKVNYTLPTTPIGIQEELTRIQQRIVDLESFLNQMIEIQRSSGIQGISYFTNLRRVMKSIAKIMYVSLVGLMALSASCSEEQPEISRVQTNLVEKSIFDGEWWYSSTAIDVSYDEAFVFNSANALAPFSGSMSTDYALDYNRGGRNVLGTPAYSFPIARVRFVVDEKFLFAYRSYELVAGGNGDAHDADFLGQPLAVFAIEDHVDVRKEYDDVTGETNNVTAENTTDRKWYERKFMRVDWSRNLLEDFSANDVQANELFTAFRRESVPFFIQVGAHSDFPKSYQPEFIRVGDDKDYARRDEWDLEEDKDTVHYMSFVTQETWSPQGSCLSQGGTCANATATMRNAFLRVPPKHEYAVLTETNGEFDRFGLFRSHQPSYARGGADTAVEKRHCTRDSDCGPGGACDTAQRRAADCQALGKTSTCRVEQNICIGGLTEDQGETDFLNFYVSRLNLYSDSLTDQGCSEDWECDGRYGQVCDSDDPKKCYGAEGSQCDLAAKRCTLPLDKRKVRPLQWHLTRDFPPYLVRRAFDAMGQWNEAMMKAQRATRALLPFDQKLCGSGGDEVCTTDLSKEAQISCQMDDPTSYCFCGSPEDNRGKCRMGYDPFEKPADAKARGIPSPYDCYIEGPADVKNPTSYEDYSREDAYSYRFKGSECILTLQANSCDRDPKKPCEELGDLRYNFISHLQHGGAGFGGVAQPLSDPKTGELVVSTATMASESIESIGTLASQFFPVLRGDVPEDSYFTGENVRGYYGRLGKVEHPVATVPSNTSGNEINDESRPTRDEAAAAEGAQKMDATKQLQERMQRVAAKVAKLKGQEGRTATFSGRKAALRGKPIDAQLASSLQEALKTPTPQTAAGLPKGNGTALDAPMAELAQERERRQAMSTRNMDIFDEGLYNSQYYRYFADRFKDRSTSEASLRMQQAYFRGVALHELGHVLGLRHNFAGSLDRNNYHDAYYKLATQSPLPNILEYDDPIHRGNGDGQIVGEEVQRFASELRDAREERLQQGASNVMTASIMDYNANLSDYAGLGRYDRAAAAFAYFGKVEAYETGTPEADPSLGPADSLPLAFADLERPDLYRRELWSYYRGGESCQTADDCPNRAGRNVTAFQSISQRCVPNPRLPLTGACSEPGSCVCSNFYDDFDAYQNGTAYRGRSEPARFAPVKYMYCHDNRLNDLSWCSQSDAGESFQEVVEHYRRSWRERYPRAYFRNFRASGPAKGSSYSTVVEAVKIYQHMFFRQSFDGPEYRSRLGSAGYYDQLFASAATLDWLAEIIGMPDVGSYKLDPASNTYRQVSPTPGDSGGDVDLGVGEGYYLWSQYQTGQNGFFRLERAGTFLDKLLAIQAITKRDWGLTYQVDEFYYVNFFDVFEREVIDLFGGLIMRNPRQYAPRLENGTLSYMSLFRMDDRPNNDTAYPAPAVDGTDTEVLRDIATIEALSEFPVYYDTSFEQRLLVFKLGSGDGYTIPTKRKDGTPTCKFGDANCDKPDYIVYDSDRLHTAYVAVVVDPEETGKIDEQQLAFQLLKGLTERQARLRTLRANANRNAAEQTEFERLAPGVERDESFLEYLIELERQLGISSYFF